jgi:phospholipid/cholesterol/gamma-HCH transport system substrate-binding protein
MASEGDLFKAKRTFYAAYANASGLTKGNRILMDGYKIGFVKSINYNPGTRRTIVGFKVTEKVPLTTFSVAKIISTDMFGTRAITITRDTSLVKYFAETELINGDTLVSETEPSMTESISKVLSPIADKTENILNFIDSFLNSTDNLSITLKNFDRALVSFSETSDKAGSILNQNTVSITETVNNMKQLSKTLAANQENIDKIIQNSTEFSDELKAVELAKLSKQMDDLLVNLNSITAKIDKGDGTVGQLINNEEVYINLNKSLAELNKLLLDINKYPEKYVPMPWGNKQRKKAKAKSADEPYNN